MDAVRGLSLGRQWQITESALPKKTFHVSCLKSVLNCGSLIDARGFLHLNMSMAEERISMTNGGKAFGLTKDSKNFVW